MTKDQAIKIWNSVPKVLNDHHAIYEFMIHADSCSQCEAKNIPQAAAFLREWADALYPLHGHVLTNPLREGGDAK